VVVTYTGAVGRAATDAPTNPGVYCFLGDAHELLYVGKATNLRARLAQHTRGGGARPIGVRSQVLYQRVREVRVEDHESPDSAAAREADLVVALRPPFNASLRLEGRWNYVVVSFVAGRRRLALSRGPTPGRTPQFGCFPHLGPGTSSRPGRACTDGYAALERMLAATAEPPPGRSLSAFLSGASSRLLDGLRPPDDSYLGPAFARDRAAALEFFRYGPHALRALRARHGLRAGLLTRERFTQLIETELRASIGDDVVIVPVDENAERMLGRRAHAWAEGLRL
jgi:predicted GIY-YIG superfamily endonuclease